MKLIINLSLFIFFLIIIGEKSFSLTNYQIKKICKKEERELTCIKFLKERKFNLQKGKAIEIPVIPYEGN